MLIFWFVRVCCLVLLIVVVIGLVVDIIGFIVFLCWVFIWERLSMSGLILFVIDFFGIFKRFVVNYLSGVSICLLVMS